MLPDLSSLQQKLHRICIENVRERRPADTGSSTHPDRRAFVLGMRCIGTSGCVRRRSPYDEARHRGTPTALPRHSRGAALQGLTCGPRVVPNQKHSLAHLPRRGAVAAATDLPVPAVAALHHHQRPALDADHAPGTGRAAPVRVSGKALERPVGHGLAGGGVEGVEGGGDLGCTMRWRRMYEVVCIKLMQRCIALHAVETR